MSITANLEGERKTFVTHLECSLTGERYEADELHGLSAAGRPLLVRYDLQAIGTSLSPGAIESRPTDLWRWRELLPVRRTESIVSLGEIETPLISIPRSAAPNVIVVKVPDERVDRLAALFSPKKTTYADVTYVDVAIPVGGAVVFVTQNLEELERFASRVVVMLDGGVVFDGSLAEYEGSPEADLFA